MMATITNTFRSFDGATIHVLSDGRAVRDGITGLMLLGTDRKFVRYIDHLDEVVA